MNFAEAIMSAYPMIEICGVQLDPLEVLRTMRPDDYAALAAAWESEQTAPTPRLELVHSAPHQEISDDTLRPRPTLVALKK